MNELSGNTVPVSTLLNMCSYKVKDGLWGRKIIIIYNPLSE